MPDDNNTNGQSDTELAKMLMDRQARCKLLELDLADTRQSLKMSQIHIKEWQAKYNALKDSITFDDSVIGFQIVQMGPPLKKLSMPLPIDEAAAKLLKREDAGTCVLVPVLDRDIERTCNIDDSDEGGEPVA